MAKQTEPSYDLFVSYAEADGAWVEGYLLDALTQAGMQVHSEEAFRLGVPRVLEFERAVRESARTLLALSPAYVAEGFAQFTDLLAQSYGLETATWPVIPLILRPVELPPRLAMLTALDATDQDNWEAVVERLCAELERPAPGTAPKPPCPYPGMVPFSEADSERFFGRDTEIQELLERLRLHSFITVIGPSGSGKSSLVFAGLVPALRESGLFGPGEWLVRSMRPGEAPLDALADALDGDPAHPDRAPVDLLVAEPDARRLLLVVDQLEELFGPHVVDGVAFEGALLRLAQVPNCTVVLTARADFYPDLMASPLWREIQAHRLEVLPLNEDGLREAIVRPAEDVGVFVEAALVERLVKDAADEPGVLPFVQETMVLLWEDVERRFLPLRAYEALVLPRRAYGAPPLTGLQVAMARRADAALAALIAEQQTIARRIFLRLVQFGEGRADTRRQQPVASLRAAGDDPAQFEETLRHLADQRLLTLSGEEEGADRRVDIAHEALISGWPKLGGWLDERRQAEQTRRRLEAKAAEWERLGRGNGGLLDEVELLEAERWLAGPEAADLGYGELLSALVEASRGAQEEAAAQQRRAARFRLGALGAIAVLIIAALGIGLWSTGRVAQEREAAAMTAEAGRIEAVNARATAEAEADARATEVVVRSTAQAETVAARSTAEAERDRAEEQAREARLALSGQLGGMAQVVLDEYPQRSLLLAVEALSVTIRAGEPRAPAAEDALRQALANSGGRGLSGHEDSISAVAISSDNRWLVTGSGDNTARLWDLTAEDPAAEPIVLRGHESYVDAVAISPDNRWLVTGSTDTTARLWDFSALLNTGLTAEDPTAAPVVLRGHEGAIAAVAISSDSHWLATGSDDATARLWDLTAEDPAASPVVLRGHDRPVFAVAISPDNHWLVTGSWDFTARLWDLSAEDLAAAPIVLRGHERSVEAVAISSDSHWLVTASGDATARLWDLTAPDPAAAPIILRGHEGRIRAVAISPDNHWVATGSEDTTARLWDVSALLNTGLTAKDLPAAPIVLRGHEDWVDVVAISADSHWLVTGSRDHTPRLWDLTTSAPAPAPKVLRGHEGRITAAAISPDSHWLVTGGADNSARLWDLTASDPVAAPNVLRGYGGPIQVVVTSPDSHWLVTSSSDSTVRLWDLTAPDSAAVPIVLRGHDSPVFAVAISPDNHWLVTGGGDNTTRLWDLTAEDPAAAPTVLGGHESYVTAVAISPNSRWLVTGSADTSARLWDLTAEDPTASAIVLRGHEDRIVVVAISPDSRWLVTGSADTTARLWDLTAEDPAVAPIVLRGHETWIDTVAISHDNHWLVTGSEDNTGILWDLTREDPAGGSIVLGGHESSISVVAISLNSHWLATSGGWPDSTARLWDLTAPDPAARHIVLRGHEDWITIVAISPDSHWLVTGSRDGTARLWDLTAPDPAAAPIVLRGHEGRISGVVISPDNHWLVTAGDAAARLWDLGASDPAAAPVDLRGGYHNPLMPGLQLAISPDSHWLVTDSDDGTARLWNLRLDELVDLACRTAGRNLSREEWEQYFPGQAYRRTCPSLPPGRGAPGG